MNMNSFGHEEIARTDRRAYLSVVIPVYNEERTIRALLEKDFEEITVFCDLSGLPRGIGARIKE